ncbi:MAG: hypothetical protein Q8881_04110, partial [Sweet potato little leaf phytoplasma]|nr:hypothetical protein [Sweet potato little leaf phytoplasma]
MAEFLPNFALGDVSPKTAEFLPNFAVRDASNDTAESIPPIFALGTIPTKRPNFRRISLSGRFRQNGRLNPAEFLPNLALGDVSDETAELPPNFALVDVSNKMDKFPTNFALG